MTGSRRGLVGNRDSTRRIGKCNFPTVYVFPVPGGPDIL
jgi:hypothetical protein